MIVLGSTMSLKKLTASQIEPLLALLNDELGKADQERARALLRLHTSINMNHMKITKALFPGQASSKAQSSFRSFRSRLNNAAEEKGVSIMLQTDSDRHNVVSDWLCWFESEESKASQIAQYSSEEASDQDSEKLVPARGRIVGAISQNVHIEKPLIRLFISYARKDNRDKKGITVFFDELNECFKASKNFRYELWADWEILIGEEWHDEISRALNECDFGLMMVSLPFINSSYIDKYELPNLLDTGRALPVAFKKFDIDAFDLKGLRPQQIFRHKDKFYNQYTGSRKTDFIQALFHNIEKHIKKTFEQELTQEKIDPDADIVRPSTLKKNDSDFTHCPETTIAKIVKVQANEGFDPHHTESRGRPVGIKTVLNIVENERIEADETAIIATEYLFKWASDEKSPPFCAVLGEYGIGKTTTLKAFTRQLLEQRERDKKLPLPIYIDLREYSWDKRVDFDLNDILTHILKKSWKGGHAGNLINSEDIFVQVQENRALMIWDGLDEVIVHMEPKYANDFIRQLWRILPPLKQDRALNPNAGKMLISCRSHYFRDVNQQNSMLTSEHRDGIKGENYEALILLPFGQRQIETYLQKSLGITGIDLHKTIDIIRSVHNLPEMAERPYTLSLIAQHIPQIEELSLRGEVIQGVTLYKSMVNNWLARDAGKHQFSPQDKKRLMEYLAAALWQSGQRQWTVNDLDEWLDDFLYENQRIADVYRNLNREVLKEDLRTATFITRPDDEHFRFAHTSLQEYFLASYLHRGLYTQQRKNWQLFSLEHSYLPSNETLDFLVQLYSSEPRHQLKCKESMSLWLKDYEFESSTLLFKVWLLLFGQNEVISYRRLSLPKVDLSHWNIHGKAHQNLLIHDADFSNSQLNNVVFHFVLFRDCIFSNCNLNLGEFQNCKFENCKFDGADLSLSIWRHNDLSSLNIKNCNYNDSQWIHNHNQSSLLIRKNERLHRIVDKLHDTKKNLVSHLTLGHRDEVTCILFSPDGKQILSASKDNTVKLWDSENYCLLQSFEEHSRTVRSIAFHPNKKQIASGSDDETIKLWDINSGECLKSITGHLGAISYLVFDRKGTQLASGSEDKTIKLWDIGSSKCLRSFDAHTGAITSISYSPDGKQIASGSQDKTVKVWGVNNGKCLNSFEEHSDPIISVDFIPSGKQIVSGSCFGAVKFWSIDCEQSLRTIEENETNQRVSSIAFNFDRKLITFGLSDGYVKLKDMSSGKDLQFLREGYCGLVNSVAICPKGQKIICSYSFNIVALWDINESKCQHVFNEYTSAVTSIAFSPDSQKIVSGSDDNTIKLWDVNSGKCLASFKMHSRAVSSVAFSPNGKQIVSGSVDKTIKLWDINSGECVYSFEAHTEAVSSVEFSTDGKQIVSGSADKTIKLWDVESGKLLRSFEKHTNAVTSVMFSNDGKELISSSGDYTTKLWNIEYNKCLYSFGRHSNAINVVAFSPSGKEIASGSRDNLVKLVSLDHGHSLHSFDQHTDSVYSVAFSLDGKQLISASEDNTIKLWDIITGNCLHTFKDHSYAVRSVAFSPDGELIASGSGDSSIKFWDSKSKTLLKSSYHLPRNSAATVDEQTGRIIFGSREAWRYFCYIDRTEENICETIQLPAEVFGPLD